MDRKQRKKYRAGRQVVGGGATWIKTRSEANNSRGAAAGSERSKHDETDTPKGTGEGIPMSA